MQQPPDLFKQALLHWILPNLWNPNRLGLLVGTLPPNFSNEFSFAPLFASTKISLSTSQYHDKSLPKAWNKTWQKLEWLGSLLLEVPPYLLGIKVALSTLIIYSILVLLFNLGLLSYFFPPPPVSPNTFHTLLPPPPPKNSRSFLFFPQWQPC